MYATKGGKQASCLGSGKFSEFEKFPDERDDSTQEYQEIFWNLKNSQMNRMTVVSPLKHFTGRLSSRCYFRWCFLSW
jgi:hypothetical protein